jgi:hypothetical protein
MTSRELLSEPNVYNTAHSPNINRLEEKELEYRTILNKAARAIEKTHHQPRESQESHLYTVKQHQASVESETMPTEEKWRKSIKYSGAPSTIGGRASLNSSISNPRESSQKPHRRSCCTVSSSDSSGRKK